MISSRPTIASRIPALWWRWAYTAWCADEPVDVIASRIGITRRQLYGHANKERWPARAARDSRPRPTRWRCDCGRVVASGPVCGCGQVAGWKAMEDAGLLPPVRRVVRYERVR